MSATETMVAGKLAIDIETDSIYFGINVPLQIRDNKMQVVERPATDREFNLDPGLYQVSAVLEDGQEHSKLIEVKSNETTSVKLGTRQSSRPSKAAIEALSRPMPPPSFTDAMLALRPSIPESDEMELVGLEGADVATVGVERWRFTAKSPAEIVPTATFEVSGHRTILSLPTSPGGGMTENSCVVRPKYANRRVIPTAWISPDRTVANAFMNMLAAGNVRHAAGMAKEASDLLRDKYSDPTGATLGALILHKVGLLRDRESWLKNLANDFAWIPDGRVMLASLYFRKREKLDEAMQLALEASGQRMLYTDSYSILLDLLRRWPRESDRGTRYEAMRSLAELSTSVDWDSICLSNNQKS